MSIFSKRAALGMLLAAVATAPAAAQTTIGNTVSLGSSGCTNIGATVAACGQSFTTPAGPDDVFQTFEFLFSAPNALEFSVRAWDGTHATGPVLFSQAVAPVVAPTWVLFEVGGIALPAGTQLVGYLAMDPGESVSFAFNFLDAYAGGVEATTSDVLVDAFWQTALDPADDLVFRATFAPGAVTAAPEPGTWALLATGLVALAGAARRRGRAPSR